MRPDPDAFAGAYLRLGAGTTPSSSPSPTTRTVRAAARRPGVFDPGPIAAPRSARHHGPRRVAAERIIALVSGNRG